MAANPHMNRAVASRHAVIHYVVRHDFMQPQNVLARDVFPGGFLFHETQAGKIVHHLTFGDGGHFPSSLHRADLFQREWISKKILESYLRYVSYVSAQRGQMGSTSKSNAALEWCWLFHNECHRYNVGDDQHK